MAAQAGGEKGASVAIEKLRGGGAGPYDPGMDTRIAKLEGSHDGLKQSQSILIMSVMGLAGLFFTLAAIMVTLQVFTFNRIDQVETKLDAKIGQLETKLDAKIGQVEAKLDAKIGQIEAKLDAKVDALGVRVDALPALISQEFRAMRADMTAQTNAIANAITAARQPAPPVIVPPPPGSVQSAP